MTNQRERISYLLQRYAENLCSREEYEELFGFVSKNGNADTLAKGLADLWKVTGSHPQQSDHQWETIYSQIMEKGSGNRTVHFQTWKRIAVAAAILIISTVSVLIFFNQQPKYTASTHIPSRSIAELVPGGNNAVLTLASGEKIVLNEKHNGMIANQSGVTVTKSADGQIVYSIQKKETETASTGFNSIETPKGGQYQLILPDGTKVWLNAMSSLRFPMRFGANERRVELTGEGYFEVAKNKLLPFRIKVPGQYVEVLGTHFNINAYANEKSVRTTLLEGSVKVLADGLPKPAVLSPGMQSRLTQGNLSVEEVDTELAVSWKNGSFIFNKDNLESIMRQISRWYDVDVEYKNDEVRSRLFSGSISRFENASQVLDILELTGMVRFKVEGRRITVM